LCAAPHIVVSNNAQSSIQCNYKIQSFLNHQANARGQFSVRVFEPAGKNRTKLLLGWVLPGRLKTVPCSFLLFNLQNRSWDPDVMILKIFSPKNSAKNGDFVSKQSQILKKVDHNIGF
jgi:hypothetical protein